MDEIVQDNARETEVKEINNRLALMYGTNVNISKANFRLIMAGNCYEKRAGELSYNGVYLRDEVKEVKKYPWLDDGQWIVERLIPNPWSDVMEGGWTYECVYAFKIFPIWRAIEHLIHCLFNPKGPRTQKEADYLEVERMEIEKKKMRDRLDTTPLETSLNDGSAMSYTNTKGIDYRPTTVQKKFMKQNDIIEEREGTK